MLTRHAVVLLGFLGSVSAASAQSFHIEDVPSATALDVAQLKPSTIAFNDHAGGAPAESEAYLTRFSDWASKHPNREKVSRAVPRLYRARPSCKAVNGNTAQLRATRLYMYVAQARFLLDRAPGLASTFQKLRDAGLSCRKSIRRSSTR
jgi:hypothetical protein